MRIDVSSEVMAVKDKLYKSTAYDIRAFVGKPGDFFGPGAVLTPEAMRVTGALMGSMVFSLNNGAYIGLQPGNKVVVGHDNGPTSVELAEAFSEGLAGQGIDVYYIGTASSGQVYHNQMQFGAQGHVQITRSHVEVTTNGAKFGIGIYGIHTYLLQQMNEGCVPQIGRECAPGKIYDKISEGRKLYFDKMTARYGEYFALYPRRFAVNLFGGTGLEYETLYRKILGDQVTILGNKIDVNDGELLADPTRREMMEKVPGLLDTLQQGLRVHSFDLDADRGALTEGADALETGKAGHYLGDDLAYILADYKLACAVPNLFINLAGRNLSRQALDEIHRIATTVLVDPRYTSGVRAFVEQRGGTTIYHRKGHSLWKETMTENLSKMAGLAGYEDTAAFVREMKYQDLQIEASLHLFVTDPEDAVPRDDAVENVFLLEKILDELGIRSLREYFSAIPRRFATKEIRTNSVSNDIKEQITASMVEKLKNIFSGPAYQLVEFEGQIRADWETGFLMYGMSNTSPKLTFMAEGSTVEERNEALAFILAMHNKYKKIYNDTLGMDVAENGFFMNDPSYNMPEPDTIDFQDARVQKFCKVHRINAEV